MPGYTFVSQSGHSLAGGVGYFIKEDLNYIIRGALSSATDEYESLWLEIDSPKQKILYVL